MVVSIGTMQQGFVGDWAIVPLMKEQKKEKEKKNRVSKVIFIKFSLQMFYYGISITSNACVAFSITGVI